MTRTLLAVAVGVATLVGAALPAAANHSNAISCYAYVHDQCYGGGANNCSKADYEWGLDQCDGYYASSTSGSGTSAVRPSAPGGPALRAGTNREIRAIIERSMPRR